MISRRGLFRLLTGAVASPVLKPLAAMIPVSNKWKGECDHPQCQPCFSNPVGICLVGSGPSEVMRIWYDAHGREMRELRKRLSLTEFCQPRPLPVNTGNKIVFFRYAPVPPC